VRSELKASRTFAVAISTRKSECAYISYVMCSFIVSSLTLRKLVVSEQTGGVGVQTAELARLRLAPRHDGSQRCVHARLRGVVCLW
jgi:hypothetical protein